MSQDEEKKANREKEKQEKEKREKEKREKEKREKHKGLTKPTGDKDALEKILKLMEEGKKEQSEMRKEIKEIAEKVEEIDHRIDEIDNTIYADQDQDYEEAEDEDEMEYESQECHRMSESEEEKSIDQEENNNDRNLRSEITEDNNKFKGLSENVKKEEVCSKNVHPDLAKFVNAIFREGMDQESYKKYLTDDINPRPENCEALVPVRLNQPVWDALKYQSRNVDFKFQETGKGLIKAAVKVTKALNTLTEVETEVEKLDQCPEDIKIGIQTVSNNMQDALLILGHTNYAINISRKELIKSEVKDEYAQLCKKDIGFTKFLFGDNLSQAAQDAANASKLTKNIKPTQASTATRGRKILNYRFRGLATRGRPYFKRPYAQPYDSYEYNYGPYGSRPPYRGSARGSKNWPRLRGNKRGNKSSKN